MGLFDFDGCIDRLTRTNSLQRAYMFLEIEQPNLNKFPNAYVCCCPRWTGLPAMGRSSSIYKYLHPTGDFSKRNCK
jgi:hypothetical protein